jgi:hypothetical protein
MLLLLLPLLENNKLKAVLENTFTGLENLFNEDLCNFLPQTKIIDLNLKSVDSYSELLQNSYKEVLEHEDEIFRKLSQLTFEDLKEIGLVGSQLDLKIKLYRDQLQKVVSQGGKFYDFTDKVLQAFFIGELDNLLELLGSLLKKIPILEPLFEFLQCIRSITKEMANNQE